MKKKLVAVVVALAVISFYAFAAVAAECKQPAPAPMKKGMKVVAQWSGDNWWIATVDKVKGNRVDVTYSDNTKGQNKEAIASPGVLFSGTKPCYKVGDKVVAKWNKDSWWKATITNLNQNLADITYSDNTKGQQSVNDMVPDFTR